MNHFIFFLRDWITGLTVLKCCYGHLIRGMHEGEIGGTFGSFCAQEIARLWSHHARKKVAA